jgi:hypothetical protein
MNELLRDGWPTLLLRLSFLSALVYGEYRLIKSIKKSDDLSLGKCIGSFFLGLFILVVFMGLFEGAGGGHGYHGYGDECDPQWGR